MARGTLSFKEADVRRAWSAAQKQGLPIVRTEIATDGKIVLVHCGESIQSDKIDAGKAWLENYNARQSNGNRA